MYRLIKKMLDYNSELIPFRRSSKNTKIIPKDHLQITAEPMKQTITVSTLGNDPNAHGKVLATKFSESLFFKNYTKIINNFNAKNHQFLAMYEIFGSGKEDYLNRILPITPENDYPGAIIENHYTSKYAAEGLLDLFCNSDLKFTTPYEMITSQKVSYFVPQGTKAHLLRKINNSQMFYNKYLKLTDQEKLKTLKKELKQNKINLNPEKTFKLQQSINAIEMRMNAFGEMRKFVKNRLTIEPKAKNNTNTIAKKTVQQPSRSRPMNQSDALKILQEKSIMHNTSDEEIKLFYSSKTKTLHLIDAGNPATADNLNILAEVAQENGIAIAELIIHPTHFHFDHVQDLYKTIEVAAVLGITTNLNIPSATAQQFIGSLVVNLEILEPLVRRKKVKLSLLDDETYDQRGEVFLLPPAPADLRHYITSRGYFVKKMNQGFLFTGDWNNANFKPTKDLLIAFKQYFETNLKLALAVDNLHIFLDIGHFPEYAKQLETIINETAKQLGLKYRPAIHFDHQKTLDDYAIEVLDTDNPALAQANEN